MAVSFWHFSPKCDVCRLTTEQGLHGKMDMPHVFADDDVDDLEDLPEADDNTQEGRDGPCRPINLLDLSASAKDRKFRYMQILGDFIFIVSRKLFDGVIHQYTIRSTDELLKLTDVQLIQPPFAPYREHKELFVTMKTSVINDSLYYMSRTVKPSKSAIFYRTDRETGCVESRKILPARLDARRMSVCHASGNFVIPDWGHRVVREYTADAEQLHAIHYGPMNCELYDRLGVANVGFNVYLTRRALMVLHVETIDGEKHNVLTKLSLCLKSHTVRNTNKLILKNRHHQHYAASMCLVSDPVTCFPTTLQMTDGQDRLRVRFYTHRLEKLQTVRIIPVPGVILSKVGMALYKDAFSSRRYLISLQTNKLVGYKTDLQIAY